ncbi:MAG TPA: DUF1269 domain-containing protein [Mycobacteriales bacterium]|nr:DUF1269 domain-containing protein [Mycobacteriales bacterium]
MASAASGYAVGWVTSLQPRERLMPDQNNRKLIVISFDDPLKANEFLLAAARLQKNGQIQLHDAVFIRRDKDGKSTVQETQDITTGRGAMSGALWGVLLGTLFGGPIGALIGGAASAGSGALMAKFIDLGIQDEKVKELRQTVPPGSTGLALLISHLSLGDLQRELQRFPGANLVESDLPDAVVNAVQYALHHDEQQLGLS